MSPWGAGIPPLGMVSLAGEEDKDPHAWGPWGCVPTPKAADCCAPRTAPLSRDTIHAWDAQRASPKLRVTSCTPIRTLALGEPEPSTRRGSSVPPIPKTSFGGVLAGSGTRLSPGAAPGSALAHPPGSGMVWPRPELPAREQNPGSEEPGRARERGRAGAGAGHGPGAAAAPPAEDGSQPSPAQPGSAACPKSRCSQSS